MAERRPPGFNVPVDFYDGPEVKSIPRRIRAAAVGVWTLCGNYAATKLTDGYVDAETLKQQGCTPAVRAALGATVNIRGEHSPLWIDGPNGGICFTNWPKWQRTNEEVSAYRASEADRKRNARKAKRNGTGAYLSDSHAGTSAYLDTSSDFGGENLAAVSGSRVDYRNASASGDSEMSARTTGGQPADVQPESGETKTKTETELSTYVDHEHAPNVGADERGLTAPIHPSASRLVATLIPDTIPAAVRTGLRIAASELINRDKVHPDTVTEALRRWLTKPGAGPGLLAHIAADIIREQATPATTNTNSAGQPHKMRALAELAATIRAQEQAAETTRKELA